MTEEAAFLEAMLANPNDLALRLVFADWLEERGDPRGELLRLTNTLTQAIEVSHRPRLETRLQALAKEGVPPVGPFWTNAFDMCFAWIPPGTFLMGSPDSEHEDVRQRYGQQIGDWTRCEKQHRVVLSQGFALGTTPVTQVQWQAVMRDNPSHFRGDHLPVECVSWFDAIAFCNALSEKTARKPFYQLDAEHVTIVGGDGYRLPTEAEWEYACRAGATTVYSFGNDDDQLDAYAWYAANATGQTQAVAQRTPNAWGLFDMHGNVLEWCWDWFINYPPAEVTDPQGPSKGVRRVMRGGSWGGNPCGCRSAFRFRQAPNDRDQYIGFRVCFQPAPR